MLPKKNRISRKDFPSHKAQGRRVFTPFFSAVFYRSKDAAESRVSVVVSKKTAKSAVSRNTLRRRFYDLLAPYVKVFSTPTTIVVYPKSDALKAQFSVLGQEMEKALKQARLI